MKAVPALLALCLALTGSLARAESFDSWYAKAEKAKKRGDWDAAAEAYTAALSFWKKSNGKPAKARLLSSRAAVYERKQDWERSVADLSQAVLISSRTASLYYRLGSDYLELSKPSEAITHFYKAVRLNLNYKEAYLGRATAYEQLGDAKFAREDYRMACRLGSQKACAIVRPPKPKKKAAPARRTQAAGPAPRDESLGVEVSRAGTSQVFKLDFRACVRGLNACVDSAGTFGDCVKKAKICETSPRKGCCPEACVKEFNSMTFEDRSEADAFRELFSPKSQCSKLPIVPR